MCVALGRGLVAIDVDSDSGAVQQAIEAIIEPSPVQKIGRKGYTAFYRARPAVASTSFNIHGERALDLLAHGKQTILPPTIHPDSGQPYLWLTASTLENLTVDRLPALPDDIAARLGVALEPFGYFAPVERPPVDGDGGLWREINDVALDRLDAWVPGLGIDARRGHNGNWRGVAIWRGGDGHNVSFDSRGIRDFAENVGHTAIDVVMLAHSCDFATAEKWLRETLGFRDPPPVVFLPRAKVAAPEPDSGIERRAGGESSPVSLQAKRPEPVICLATKDGVEVASPARAGRAEPAAARSVPASEGVAPTRPAAKPIWVPKAWEWQNPRTIARLECLYGGHYYRGEVVATVSPGGVGKSLHSIVEALAMITGKPLLGEPSRGGLKVMLVNYEDSDLVLRHRVTAAMLHYGVKPEEIAGRLFVESIDSNLMCFAQLERDNVKILEPAVRALTDAIQTFGIDVVGLDPWVSLHSVDGNLSHLIQPIVTMFKSVAKDTNAAIDIVAHTRKPNGRDLTEDDALGSVAFVNKMRDVRVLNKMTEKDAEKYGLEPWEAGNFFRVDNPKHTHRPSVRPEWRQKISVSLGNGEPDLLWDLSTSVGVIAQWKPPEIQTPVDSLEPGQIEEIKRAAKAGWDRENAQAKDWAGKAVAEVLGLDVFDNGQKAKAKLTLKALIHAGHFKVEERPNPNSRGRKCKHLVPSVPGLDQGDAPTGPEEDEDDE